MGLNHFFPGAPFPSSPQASQLPPWRTLNPAQVSLSPDLHTHVSAQSPPLEGLLTCSALEELIVPSRLLSACGLFRAGLCSGAAASTRQEIPEGGDRVFLAPVTSSHLSSHSTQVCESMNVWMPLPEGGLFRFQTHQCRLGPMPSVKYQDSGVILQPMSLRKMPRMPSCNLLCSQSSLGLSRNCRLLIPRASANFNNTSESESRRKSCKVSKPLVCSDGDTKSQEGEMPYLPLAAGEGNRAVPYLITVP